MGLRAQPTGLTAWGESRQRTAGSRHEVGKHLNVGCLGESCGEPGGGRDEKRSCQREEFSSLLGRAAGSGSLLGRVPGLSRKKGEERQAEWDGGQCLPQGSQAQTHVY